MIFHELGLLNYGLYRGTHRFRLTPEPSNGYNRPLVVVWGKNGVGKTTLLDAIRLCLHGSLALGPRTSQAAYEAHLAGCIHVPADAEDRLTGAALDLRLDYVGEGQKRTYEIARAWHIVDDRIREQVEIRENGRELTELSTRDQKDSFLRELVAPGVAELFFFDGERLAALAEREDDALLAGTVKSLLGLVLVEQLQRDLDVYLARSRSNHGQASAQQQLDELLSKMSELESQLDTLSLDRRAHAREIAHKRQAIAEQGQRIARQGSAFAERQESTRSARQELEIEISLQRRQARELANGLLPFAVASRMCGFVADRLQREAGYEQRLAAQALLDEQMEQVASKLASPAFWQDVGIAADEATRHRILERITATLRESVQPHEMEAGEVIHRLSQGDRQMLLSWIEHATTDAPQSFCQIIEHLKAQEAELERIDRELALVPADETLRPLVEVHQHYNQELGVLLAESNELAERAERVAQTLEHLGQRRERLREQIVAEQHHDARVLLTNRTQAALREYSRALRQKKAALLGERLAEHFNDLCRKQDLVQEVQIDPESFAITLWRGGQAYDRGQLSAGERQLLAVATMWALREVSGVPMPVILDTPLGRLDREHRQNMVQEYFPRAGHQVILLVTDSEMGKQELARLESAISHVYCLSYDAARGETNVFAGLDAVDQAQLEARAGQ